MKKFLFLGLVTFILGLNYINVYAFEKCGVYNEEELEYIIKQSNPNDLDLTCTNGTPYTDEYWENIAKAEEEIKNNPKPRYFTNKLYVTPFKQDKNYYCGYAATKEVIHYINGSSKSQAQYEADMGTVGQGAYVYKITNTLNKETNKNYIYKLGTNFSQEKFKNLIEDEVQAGKPVILHAQTKSLYLYNGNNFGHYVVATGNTISSTYPYSIVYIDSWSHDYGRGSTFGEHVDKIENVFNSVNISGRYIIY